MTHIMLLTDGAIRNTSQVANLVSANSSHSQRLHTFGVGNGASEELIKKCAFSGFGQFYFIYNEAEIEDCVVKAISKTKCSYKILKEIQLFDQDRNEIDSDIKDKSETILDGEFI